MKIILDEDAHPWKTKVTGGITLETTDGRLPAYTGDSCLVAMELLV